MNNIKNTARKQNKFAHVDQLSSNEKMLRSTAWLSMGQMLSRVIGAIYIIPWAIWIGANYEIANGLYAIAYTPYILFLDISTAGFPMAITKQISQLNARNEHRASFKLFRDAMIIMLIVGFFSFLLFNGIADWLASNGPNPTGNTIDKVTVLRSLAPALLILPPLSLLRGFFQGYQQMTTPALSQILEQVVRVIYMLGMTFYIMKVANGSLVDAVAQSTFAAFIGSLVALIYLSFELFKERDYMLAKIKFSANTVSISLKDSIQSILKDSIPFVLMGAGTSLLALIDQFTFEPVLRAVSDLSEKEIAIAYAWFSANASKLTTIIGSLTAAVALAAIPSIAALYHSKKRKQLSLTVGQNLQLYLFLIFPTTGGLFIVSDAIYKVFYGDANGAGVLRSFCLTIVTVGLFSILVSTLQGMGKHTIALKALSILLIAKLLFDIILTAIFWEYGPQFSSLFASIAAVIYLWDELYKITQFNQLAVLRRGFVIVCCTLIMMVLTAIVYQVSEALLPAFGFIANLTKVLIASIVGGSIYIYLTVKIGLADRFMPAQAATIRRRLHIR